MLKRVFSNKPLIEKVLCENGIFPANFAENTEISQISQFPLHLRENSKLTRSKTINFVKICANCFYIYNFLHAKLQEFEKTHAISCDFPWIHREKRFANTFNESLKLQPVKFKEAFAKKTAKTRSFNEEKPAFSQKPAKITQENREYSFLNRQALAAHVLNLGFSASFRTLMPEISENGGSARNYKEKNVNFFEILQSKENEGVVNVLQRKKTVDVTNRGEFFRKSSVFFLFFAVFLSLCSFA